MDKQDIKVRQNNFGCTLAFGGLNTWQVIMGALEQLSVRAHENNKRRSDVLWVEHGCQWDGINTWLGDEKPISSPKLLPKFQREGNEGCGQGIEFCDGTTSNSFSLGEVARRYSVGTIKIVKLKWYVRWWNRGTVLVKKPKGDQRQIVGEDQTLQWRKGKNNHWMSFWSYDWTGKPGPTVTTVVTIASKAADYWERYTYIALVETS